MTRDATGNDPPKIVVLYCQHSVREEGSVGAESEKASGFSVRAVMMPCSSKIRVSQLLGILERGALAVEVVGCPDEKCRNLVGSRRAQKRVECARRLLDAIRVGGTRVGITRKDALSARDLVGLAVARGREAGRGAVEGEGTTEEGVTR